MSLRGSFQPPGDKSISHRIALLALLARGECRVENFSPCADCAASLAALRGLGGGVEEEGEALAIRGAGGKLVPEAEMDCGNSGTTMRLLCGVLAGVEGEYTLDGDESLRRRPMARVARPLRLMGAQVKTRDGRPPLAVRGGGLQGIDYHLPVASAQLKSALLLAGLQAEGETVIHEPAPSRDHSERLLRLMGADLQGGEGVWRVRRSRLVLPGSFRVPGDASSAAFFLCAAAILPGSRLSAGGVLLNPTRTGFLSVLERMGARLEVQRQGEQPEPWGRVTVEHGPELTACRVAAEEIPLLVDEVPILALVATQARGTTVFEGVGELRVKESDRVAALLSQLGALGARLTVRGEDLLVHGPTVLAAPAELESFGDHRIAMTLRLACLLAGGESRIRGEECTAISYPGFHRQLEELLS